MAAHSSILSWKFHGQRSLVGCSPWGLKESDTTECTQHTSSYENQCANPWCMSAVPLRSPSCCRQLCMWYGEKEPHWHCDSLIAAAATAAKLLQSCPTLCDSIDGSPLGSSVPGIFQARTLEWVAISFSNAWKWKVKVNSLSYIRLLAIPWNAAYQAPPSMRFSRQECWSGVPLPSLP